MNVRVCACARAVWCGAVRCGAVQCGAVRCGVGRCSACGACMCACVCAVRACVHVCVNVCLRACVRACVRDDKGLARWVRCVAVARRQEYMAVDFWLASFIMFITLHIPEGLARHNASQRSSSKGPAAEGLTIQPPRTHRSTPSIEVGLRGRRSKAPAGIGAGMPLLVRTD